jgi:hypothetical protein
LDGVSFDADAITCPPPPAAGGDRAVVDPVSRSEQQLRQKQQRRRRRRRRRRQQRNPPAEPPRSRDATGDALAQWRHAASSSATTLLARPPRRQPEPAPAALGVAPCRAGRALLEAPAQARGHAAARGGEARGAVRGARRRSCRGRSRWSAVGPLPFRSVVSPPLSSLRLSEGGPGPSRRHQGRGPAPQGPGATAREAAGSARERDGRKWNDGGGGGDLFFFFFFPLSPSSKRLQLQQPDARRPRRPAPGRGGAPSVRRAAAGGDEGEAEGVRLGEALRGCGGVTFSPFFFRSLLPLLRCFVSFLFPLSRREREDRERRDKLKSVFEMGFFV